MDSTELNSKVELPAETLAILADISQDINASLNLDEVLASAAAQIKRLIDYEVFAVLLPEKNSDQLYFRFAIGHRPEVVEHWRIPMDEGIIGSAAATGQPIRVGDVTKDKRYLNALDSVRSELAVPLIHGGRVIGVLDIESSQPDYFTPDQQNILVLVASRISTAVENARLYEHERNQAETLLLLNEVGREANSTLRVEEVLRRAAELTKRLIDYQIFSILLYEETEHVFRHRVTVKFGQRVQEKNAVPAHEGIVGAAATLRRAVVVPDVALDPRYVMANPETRSELAVPMLYQDRVIGVMDLESPQLNYFTPDHVQVLSILAAQFAVSLENARLYEQVARDEARMERDLTAARRIQGAMLPRLPGPEYGLDIAARVVSSRELSGDLYDFLRYGPQELAIALGDVSGKGSAAALYGAVGIGTLRSLAPQKHRPGRNASCHQRVSGRAHDRGPLHDALLCNLASRAAQIASCKCRAGTAVSVSWWTLRKDSTGWVSARNFRGSDLRPAQLHSRYRRCGRVSLGRYRRYAKSRRRILRPRSCLQIDLGAPRFHARWIGGPNP